MFSFSPSSLAIPTVFTLPGRSSDGKSSNRETSSQPNSPVPGTDSNAGDAALNVTGRKQVRIWDWKPGLALPAVLGKKSKTDIAFLNASTPALSNPSVQGLKKPHNMNIVPAESAVSGFQDWATLTRQLQTDQRSDAVILVEKRLLPAMTFFLNRTLSAEDVKGRKIVLITSVEDAADASYLIKKGEMEGVVAVNDGKVFSAPFFDRDSTSIKAFRAFNGPVVGNINKGRPTISHPPKGPEQVFQLPENSAELAPHPISVKHTQPGVTPQFAFKSIDDDIKNGARIVIFSSRGNGTVHEKVESKLRECSANGIVPIIVRAMDDGGVTLNGAVQHTTPPEILTAGMLSEEQATTLVQLVLLDMQSKQEEMTPENMLARLKEAFAVYLPPSEKESSPPASAQITMSDLKVPPGTTALGLGGTVSATIDKGAGEKTYTPTLGIGEMLGGKDLFMIDSKDTEASHALKFRQGCKEELQKGQNVAVTSGSDMIGWFAYFASKTLSPELFKKPESSLGLSKAVWKKTGKTESTIGLAASLHAANSKTPDGPPNMNDMFALMDHPRLGGAVVGTLGGEIFSPPSFEKGHTTSPRGFTPGAGKIVGTIKNHGRSIQIDQVPAKPKKIYTFIDDIKEEDFDTYQFPSVSIQRSNAALPTEGVLQSMKDDIANGARAIVYEGKGDPAMEEGLAAFAKQGIPVLRQNDVEDPDNLYIKKGSLGTMNACLTLQLELLEGDHEGRAVDIAKIREGFAEYQPLPSSTGKAKAD